MIIQIYTDGACNPSAGSAHCEGVAGPGGWAATLHANGTVLGVISGTEGETTNNRMELMAVIRGIEVACQKLANGPTQLVVRSDSKYVVDGANKSIDKWRANGWKTVSNKPVKNRALWKRLLEAMDGADITLEWVKGHSGDPENEDVDVIAKAAMVTASEACVGP